MTTLLPYAIEYRNQDLSVMPLVGKRPPEKWQYYQSHLPSEKQLRLWWGMYREANVGIITGKISQIIVIDFDYEAPAIFPKSYPLLKHYLSSFIVSKTGKGFHCIIRTDEADKIRNAKVAKNGRNVLIETRGDGGYIVAPPSIHPDYGTRYEFTNGRRIKDLKHVPSDNIIALLDKLHSEFHVIAEENPVIFGNNGMAEKSDGVIEVADIEMFLERILQKGKDRVSNACKGERNDSLFKTAVMLASFRPYLDDGIIYETLLTGANENGYIADDGAGSAMKTINSAFNKATRIELKENPFKGMGLFKGE